MKYRFTEARNHNETIANNGSWVYYLSKKVFDGIKPDKTSTFAEGKISYLLMLHRNVSNKPNVITEDNIRDFGTLIETAQNAFRGLVARINQNHEYSRKKFKQSFFTWMHYFDYHLGKNSNWLDSCNHFELADFENAFEHWFPGEVPNNVKAMFAEAKQKGLM